jgi:hypothetical protein
MYSPETLSAKAAEARRDARNALIMSIVGLFCFGFIFGFFAYRKANDAIEIIDIYDVARDTRGLATTAKVLAIVDVVLWGIGLLIRIFLR